MTNMINREFKDSIFRRIFQEPDELLSLYNAVCQTNYSDSSQLQITTLENAIYMNIKNDIGFIFQNRLNMFEHQSTRNPNMPLRMLYYVADTYQAILTGMSIYGSKRLQIPAPRFVVFYNGTAEAPAEQKIHLSELYVPSVEQPELDLTVTVLNINSGYNKSMKSVCKKLNEYCEYVELVRRYQKDMPIKEAVNSAVDYCIENNILSDFLRRNKEEAIMINLYEYDEELHMKTIREEGVEEGIEKGIEKGINSDRQMIRRVKDLLKENSSYDAKIIAKKTGFDEKDVADILELIQ